MRFYLFSNVAFYFYLFGYSIILTVITGCAKNPDLKGFDQELWRRDTRSCQNVRASLLDDFRKVSFNLTGLSHREIISILGKPEGESLENSGMRVFYYYTQPGPHCEKKPSAASRIAIRFDVLDRVNEVMFIN